MPMSFEEIAKECFEALGIGWEFEGVELCAIDVNDTPRFR